MNVRIRTVAQTSADVISIKDATVSYDTTVLEVVHGAETITFPLANVLWFTTSESNLS